MNYLDGKIKLKILIIDTNSSTGFVVNKILTDKKFDVRYLNLEYFSDKLDFSKITEELEKTQYNFVINFARIINEEAENNISRAIQINSLFPRLIEKKLEKSNTKIIHISTDCVFSGLHGPYNENDTKEGKTIYAITRGLGEINNSKDLTIRTSIVGPDIKENGTRLFNWFMTNKNSIVGYNQVYWSGITSIELSKILINLFKKNIIGIKHVISKKISKYYLLQLFNRYFKKMSVTINKDNVRKNNKVLLV
jgi:dTDP-4-dehydrorhamnose reductase